MCLISSKCDVCLEVVAVEPTNEPALRINCTQTALVLGGSVPSAVPPDPLTIGPKGFVPIQEETVKNLASILAPAICSSELSSKFRVSVLLYGLAGVLRFCLLFSYGSLINFCTGNAV